MSEYTAPPGCVEIASTERTGTLAYHNRDVVIERLFVQERFADRYEPDQRSLFDAEVE